MVLVLAVLFLSPVLQCRLCRLLVVLEWLLERLRSFFAECVVLDRDEIGIERCLVVGWLHSGGCWLAYAEAIRRRCRLCLRGRILRSLLRGYLRLYALLVGFVVLLLPALDALLDVLIQQGYIPFLAIPGRCVLLLTAFV